MSETERTEFNIAADPELKALLADGPTFADNDEENRLVVLGERDAFERSLVPSPYRFVRNSPLTRISEMQGAARDMNHDRRSFVLAAPTSSGKTLAFAAPIFEAGRPAVFVYPYRALLYDQASELLRIASWFGYGPDDFGYLLGGVTRQELVEQIEGKRYILATPDKLVSLLIGGREGILAATRVLSAGDFVFDEVHAYNPMMTWSLIYFLRSVRLWHEAQRRHGRSDMKPAFILSSATIPDVLWRELTQALGLTEDDRLTGPSNTGDAIVAIRAPRRSNDPRHHPIADDMAKFEATVGAMAILNNPFAAYQICRSNSMARTALLFVGQDKQSEVQRRDHLERFASTPGAYALVGSNAIEAGVDLAADWLFMETDGASSTVQRFGRAARAGRDGHVVIYDAALSKLAQNGMLRRHYSRKEFLTLLQKLHPDSAPDDLLSGLAAGPYMAFWGREAQSIVEAEHADLIETVRSAGAPALLAFRSLTPYTSYETGERIGFSALLRKQLRMAGSKVAGSPSADRYFTAEARPPVTVEVEQVAYRERSKTNPQTHYLLARLNFGPELGRHWTVVEIGPNVNPPDNILLRFRGRTIAGKGTGNLAKFFA